MPADQPTPNDPGSPDSPPSGLPTYSQAAVDRLTRGYLVASTGQVFSPSRRTKTRSTGPR